jgi:hypothetical protein
MEIYLFLWKIYVCGSLWSEFLGPRTGQHYLLLITYILFSSFLDIFLSSLLNLVGLSVIRMYIIPKSRPNLQKRFKTKSWWGMGCKLCNIHAYRANSNFEPNQLVLWLQFAVKLGSLVPACHLGFQDWNGLMQWVYELCLLSLPSLWCLCFHVVLRSLENWCMIQTHTRNSLSLLMKSDILTRYFHSSVIHEAEV